MFKSVFAGLAQLVSAVALQATGHRFESYIPHHIIGELAQLGERHVCTVEVRGSIPLLSTNLFLEAMKYNEKI